MDPNIWGPNMWFSLHSNTFAYPFKPTEEQAEKMAIFRTLARMAVQRLASDPELQAKVSRVLKKEVVPRAKQSWDQAKPELNKAKAKAQDLAARVRKKRN